MNNSRRKIISSLGTVSIISLSGCAAIDNVGKIAGEYLSTRANFGESIQYEELDITADYISLEEISVIKTGVLNQNKRETVTPSVGKILIIPYISVNNSGDNEYVILTDLGYDDGGLAKITGLEAFNYTESFDNKILPVGGLNPISPNSSKQGYLKKIYEIPKEFDGSDLKIVLTLPNTGDDESESLQWSG